MCGIFGICYTDKSKALEEWTPTELAQIMFPAIRHRGPHAFGWMTWDGNGTVEVEKHPGDVDVLENLNLVAIDPQAKWMVGHVRWATNGAPEQNINNHPIVHGDIVGVHNGIISNFEEVLEETGGREDEAALVDSEAIFAAIDAYGHRPGLKKIEGNMAVVYTRLSKPSDLYFAKNVGRPLVFARTKAGSLVFASELSVLREVWGRDLTDIRSLEDGALVRVVDGRVSDSGHWLKIVPVAPQKVSRRLNGPVPASRPLMVSGITDYFDRLRDQVRNEKAKEEEHKTPRLSKKQRQRSRRAEANRKSRYGGDGFYWWQGNMVTKEEFDILSEGENA